MSVCRDCERKYGHEHGFPDLIIPYWAWKRISPSGDDGGLLCPSCICKRLHDAGISCEGAFMSGPIISVTSPTMNVLRRVENIELAIEGRNNRWNGIRGKLSMTPLERAARAHTIAHRMRRGATKESAEAFWDITLMQEHPREGADLIVSFAEGLATLMEPTLEMNQAGDLVGTWRPDSDGDSMGGNPDEVWQAMLKKVIE